MEWHGFTGTIKSAKDGAIAQIVLQESWEVLTGMEWVSRFHPTSPTDIFAEVQTHDNLEDAWKWCKKRMEEHEKIH